MFPLGSVLFPDVGMRLHVFEQRYRRLVADVLAGDGAFGVVLIERGSEVGGGDVRASVGCLARIVEARELIDGRWDLVVVGSHRIVIDEWLDDDPYPRAMVSMLRDRDEFDSASPELVATTARFRTVCALAAEAGDPVAPIEFELPDDAASRTLQIAAFGPFGPLDRYRVLASDTVERRLELLDTMLDDAEFVLRHRLADE